MANPFIKKGAKKGLIAKAISTPFFGSKGSEGLRKEKRNSRIIKQAQKKQTQGSMYTGSGAGIPITASETSTPSKPVQSRKKETKIEGITRGVAAPSGPSLSGAKIESSPITTNKVAGKNTGRLARKAAKLRSKGEDALASGNLAKSKKLRGRYDRQTARMNKSMSNASSGYAMKPGSKQKDTPGPINSVQQDVINDLNKNFNFKNDI